MKVKLDDFNIRVLINGLYRQGRDYDSETNAEINALLFRQVVLPAERTYPLPAR